MRADAIEAAFRAACHAELAALKVGNVHRYSAGHGMEVAHFERAAAAAAPFLATPGVRVGTRIEEAVAASLKVTGLNTNLGIVLLCAPLAAAAERNGPLRENLQAVLGELDLDDAQAAFRAITAANPGGLGRHGEHDVAAPATIALKTAMALAAERDRIARQYVTDYADIFEVGLPRYAELVDAEPEARAEAVHLAFLAAFPGQPHRPQVRPGNRGGRAGRGRGSGGTGRLPRARRDASPRARRLRRLAERARAEPRHQRRPHRCHAVRRLACRLAVHPVKAAMSARDSRPSCSALASSTPATPISASR